MYRRRRLDVMLKALKECSAVTSLSKTAAAEFKRTLGYDSRVIYPGVDLDAFELGTQEPEPVIFCSAAAGEARKRVDLLVRALPLVRRERPTAELWLSDPHHEGVRRNVAGDTEGVRWVDVDDRVELARVNGAAWVAALPAFSEAFGLVLVEALACGTPVVGANAGAIPEIIDRPEVGRTFEGDDEESVARALLEALDLAADPATAQSCRARAGDFSTEKTTAEYVSLYRELGA
jgi:glycosyltransferase involved in cell wall biosynthesis